MSDEASKSATGNVSDWLDDYAECLKTLAGDEKMPKFMRDFALLRRAAVLNYLRNNTRPHSKPVPIPIRGFDQDY